MVLGSYQEGCLQWGQETYVPQANKIARIIFFARDEGGSTSVLQKYSMPLLKWPIQNFGLSVC